jgi:hypothetical protein
MHRLLFATAALLFGATDCLAQVSTMGTTAMGLPSTPGTIVSSPLSGPSPFSAVTQPGAPDTTLAPVPLALDPTTPGTAVTCAPPSGQITLATPAVSATASSSTTPSTPAAPGTIASPASTPAMTSMAPSGTMSMSVSGSATGTISPISPLGSASASTCSSTPGGPPTNGASLPLATPEIPANPPPGTIQPSTIELGGTSIDPTMTVVPTPNASACAEGATMNLATPAMMTPANATGALATPGVSALPAPSGC